MKKFLLFCIVFAVSVGFVLAGRVPTDAQGRVVITLKRGGFTPSSVRIAQGTRVVFRTTIGQSFWPAVQFHPRHTLYPDFDPRSPIGEDDEWEFTFDRTGTWPYHNHLRPREQGTVVVFDPTSGSQSACLPDLAPDDLIGKGGCWYEQISEGLAKHGVAGGFATVRQLYDEDPLFKRACHDMTHLVGIAASYDVVRGHPLVIGRDAASCGYGFFHGFVETVTVMRGIRSIEEVFALCDEAQDLTEDVVVSNAQYSCYHGVGHGLFDNLDGALWGDDERMVNEVLSECEKVQGENRDELRKQCATGVYNGLANAYADGSYGMVLREEDPLWVCRSQKDPLYRRVCMQDVSLLFIRTHAFERTRSLRFIDSLDTNEDKKATLYVYFHDEARRQFASIDPRSVAQWCRPFSSDARIACLDGLLLAMIESKPGSEYVSILSLCGSTELTDEERVWCYKTAVPRLATLYSREELESYVCRAVPVEYQEFCI